MSMSTAHAALPLVYRIIFPKLKIQIYRYYKIELAILS